MKSFASQADLQAKRITFQRLSRNCWAFAREVIRRIRGVTKKPIRYVVLTDYHAVRVLGASAYGAAQAPARSPDSLGRHSPSTASSPSASAASR